MHSITTEGLINKQELVKEIIRPTRRRKRFFNYMLDSLFFFLLFYGLVFILGMIYGSLSMLSQSYPGESMSDPFIGEMVVVVFYVVIYSSYLVYYITFEYFFGKTIGKMVTNTKVVMRDGSKPKLIKIIMRSFSRLIPFEAFSLLSVNPRGWHDTISDTMVIDDISLYSVGSKSAAQPNTEETY